MPTDNQGGKPASPGQGGLVPPSQGGLSWTQPSSSSAPSGARPLQEKNTAPVQQKLLSLKELPRSAPLAAVVGGGKTSKTTLLASFAAGAVLGLLFGWVWFEKGAEPMKEGGSTVSTNAPSAPTTPRAPSVVPSSLPKESTVTDTQSSLVVAKTQPAGLTVSIEKISVTGPSWVVVYESKEGKPGNALGAALFSVESMGGVVHLLRGTSAGQTYFVGLRLDDGDRAFSLQKDAAVQDADGKLLLAQFQAQ